MNANKSHLLLSVLFIAIVGSLINLFVKTIPLTFANAIYFCQRSFANAIAFPHTTPFFILLFLSFVFIVGFFVFAVQVLQTRRFIKKVLKKPIAQAKKLESITQALGLTNKTVVIEDRKQFSFCYGLLCRKICLSTGLIQSLTKSELKAVLLHEKYHLKNFDPLRILLGKTASSMLFFIPTLKDIQAHYAFLKEIAADEVVIRNGNKDSLISALTKLLSPSIPSLSGIVAFANSHSLENRILYLTEKKKTSIHLSKRNLLLSFFGVLLLFIVLSSSGYAVATNDKAADHSYFICPFGTMSSKNFSEELPYTPIK